MLISTNLYGWMFALSLIFGFATIALLLYVRGLKRVHIIYTLLLSIVMCLYGAFMLSIVQNINEVIKGQKVVGFSSMGAVVGMFISALLLEKVLRVKEHLILGTTIECLPLMYGIAKIGCFTSGCCCGFIYNGPLAVRYVSQPDESYFPIQIIESVVFILIFVLGITLLRKRSFFLIAVLGLVSKFLLDFLRLEHRDKIVSSTQIVCLLVLVYILWIWRWRSKRCED